MISNNEGELVRFSTVCNLFPLEAVQRDPRCQLCVLWKNSTVDHNFRSAKSFEACLEEQSKTCPYLKKKFLAHVQDQDVANQAFDKCGIEITSNAGIYHLGQLA